MPGYVICRGLFLIEIDREGDVITPVSPQDVIQSGDHLIFTGVVTTIADLERIPRLGPGGGYIVCNQAFGTNPTTVDRGCALADFAVDRAYCPRNGLS